MITQQLDCFAHVHLMGKEVTAGRAITKNFGGIPMLEVTLPEIEAVIVVPQYGDYVGKRFYPEGTKLRIKRPLRTRLFGQLAIFEIQPCKEEELERIQLRDAEVLEVISQPASLVAEILDNNPDDDYDEDDDPDDAIRVNAELERSLVEVAGYQGDSL